MATPANLGVGILYVYRGGRGLPSIDPSCLHLLLFLKLNPTDKIIINTSECQSVPQLPALRYEGCLYTSIYTILSILRELIVSHCDTRLDELQQILISEYAEYSMVLLKRATTLNFWGYEGNRKYFNVVYRMAKHPGCRQIFSARLKLFTQKMIRDVLRYDLFQPVVSYENEQVAKLCHLINHILYNKKFILGTQPSSLDAIICGYMAPILRTSDSPNIELYLIIKKHKRLCKYINNFMSTYGRPNRELVVDQEDQIETWNITHLSSFFLLTIFTAIYWISLLNAIFNK